MTKVKIRKEELFARLSWSLPDLIELEAEVVEPQYCRTGIAFGGHQTHVYDCEGKTQGCTCPCHSTPKRIEPLTFHRDAALNEIHMFDAINKLAEAVNRINKV